MEKIIFHKAISMNVTTYEILNNKGPELVSLLQEFFEYFEHYVGQDLIISYELMYGKEKSMKFNKKNLAALYEHLLKGNIESLLIYCPVDNKSLSQSFFSEEEIIIHSPSLLEVAIGCNLAATYPKSFSETSVFPNEFCLSLSEQLFNDCIPPHIQAKFIELFKSAVQLLNATTAYITYESSSVNTPMRSSFENHWGINIHRPPGFTERLRGYFWMNYMSKQHINILHGMESIQKNAPCAIVETIDHPDSPGIFLQLTEDINDFSDEQLRKLREYLWPLIDVENRKYEMYNGVPRPLNYLPGYITRLVEEA